MYFCIEKNNEYRKFFFNILLVRNVNYLVFLDFYNVMKSDDQVFKVFFVLLSKV